MLKKTYRLTLNPLFYLVILSLILLGLASILTTGNVSQETRTQAAYGTVTLLLSPGSGTLSQTQDTTIDLQINSGTEKVSSVQLLVGFDPTLIDVTSVTGDTSKLSTVVTHDVVTDPNNAALKVVRYIALNVSPDPNSHPTGLFRVATLTVRPKGSSGSTVTLNYHAQSIVGYNPSEPANNGLNSSPLIGTYTVSSLPTPTVDPAVATPTPLTPSDTPAVTTPVPTSNATPTPVPPTFAGPTNAETCDLCGWCDREKTPKPANWDACMACNYITPTPAGAPVARTGYSYTVLGCIQTNSASFVQRLLQIVIGATGGIAFVAFLIGVGILMTSGGNPTRVQLGKDILTSSLVGLAIILFAVFLLRVVGYDMLRIPGIG